MGLNPKKIMRKIIKNVIEKPVKTAKKLVTHPKKGVEEVLGGLVDPTGLGKKAATVVAKAAKGTPAKEVKLERFDPDQLQLLQQSLASLGKFQELDPYLEDVGLGIGQDIHDLLSGLGFRGSDIESGIRGAGIESRLAGLRGQLAPRESQLLSSFGMRPRHELQLIPAQPGLAQTGLHAISNLLPLLLMGGL